MKYVKLFEQIQMIDGSDTNLTVGKVYEVFTCNYPKHGDWYVLDDKGEQHHFDSIDAPADNSGFKTSDYWQEV